MGNLKIMFIYLGLGLAVVNKSPRYRSLYLLHQHLGHTNFSTINKTLALLGKEKVEGCSQFLDCNICKQCKSKEHPVAKKSHRVSEKSLVLIHSDVVGPFPHSPSKKVSPGIGG